MSSDQAPQAPAAPAPGATGTKSGQPTPPGEPGAPGQFQPSMDPEPEQFRRDQMAIFWTVLFGLILAYFAWSSLAITIDGIQASLRPDGPEAQAISDGAANITGGFLWLNLVINLAIFGAIPVTWVWLTRVQPKLGTWRYFHLHLPDIGRQLATGVGLGLAMWLGAIIFVVIRLATSGDLADLASSNSTDGSPVTAALMSHITWPLAIAIALSAGIGEELFFRGVLQKWIGWWGQAIVFGATHASYGTPDQIILPFIIGLLFGWLVRKGRGLWLVMAAHFTFNFVQLALVRAFGTG